MKLVELINELEVVSIKGSQNIDITEIGYDSRRIGENSLFVAIEGFKLDGHNFIDEAINRGAKAIIAQRDVHIDENITLIIVKNSRIALAKISSIFYRHPSKKINLIGVTGTNAKTTTTYLVKSIFEAAKRKTGLIGTIGSIVDNELVATNNTTPESLDLQKIFDLMVKSNIDTCIMEVSSHSLELNRTDYCDFDTGIFTNLSVDHLDFHKSIENYLKAKMKLFYKTRKYNVVNIDDKYGEIIINEIKDLDTPILTYGIEKSSDISATDIRYSAEGVGFKLVTPTGDIAINMKIPGLFSVYNGLSAAACSYAYGISLENIKSGLESVQGVKGRFEVVPTNRDFTVIIDYAHTPDGLEKVMETINKFAKGRKIVLFGAGGERGQSRRAMMGEVAAKYSDLCVVTSDNARSEDPQQIINDIVEGIINVNGKYVTFVDRRKAIEYAIVNSQPDDVILLAGKGHETYQIIGDKKIPLNEREIVLEILEKMK